MQVLGPKYYTCNCIRDRIPLDMGSWSLRERASYSGARYARGGEEGAVADHGLPGVDEILSSESHRL